MGRTSKPPAVDRNAGLGAMLRALRKSRGMTQGDVAALAGLERTSVCNIESGRQMLTVQTINALAGAMGYRVRVQFILTTSKGD